MKPLEHPLLVVLWHWRWASDWNPQITDKSRSESGNNCWIPSMPVKSALLKTFWVVYKKIKMCSCTMLSCRRCSCCWSRFCFCQVIKNYVSWTESFLLKAHKVQPEWFSIHCLEINRDQTVHISWNSFKDLRVSADEAQLAWRATHQPLLDISPTNPRIPFLLQHFVICPS